MKVTYTVEDILRKNIDPDVLHVMRYALLYSVKFYNAKYLSNATYKLLYYTIRTDATESKNVLQIRSLNIENEEITKRK